MKPLGATLFASALALVAGCSSGGVESPRLDPSAQSSESLRAPSPGEPENDPCASVRCAGTECVVVDGNATCAEADINPCAAVLCLEGSTCEVLDGEPVCTPNDAGGCAAVSCLVGNACEIVDGEPVCVPVAPTGPFCGGFGGFACPGSGTCVDAVDSCDPENGGADCGGVCECNIRALCVQGFAFDESPQVCACVEAPELDPCSAVRCAEGTECVVVDGSASCEPSVSPCAVVLCQTGTTCEVVDGDAVCTPIEPPSAPFCGGFGGFACPGSGTCVDAADSCDPENGGADCGGVCECNIRALCIQGFVFDESPQVCACVEAPELDPCAVVRCAAGTECVVVDGSASCEPTESPCALVDCFPDNICQVVEGEAVCVPVDSHDCK
jgi:hypothetical protein